MSLHICLHTCVYTCLYTDGPVRQVAGSNRIASLSCSTAVHSTVQHTSLHTCLDTSRYTHVWIHFYRHVYIHVYTHVYINVYTCLHTRLHMITHMSTHSSVHHATACSSAQHFGYLCFLNPLFSAKRCCRAGSVPEPVGLGTGRRQLGARRRHQESLHPTRPRRHIVAACQPARPLGVPLGGQPPL